MKPIIGISGNQLLKPIDTFEGEKVAYTPQRFVQGVETAGGIPLVLPIGTEEAAERYMELVDGLLLTGGHDVDPARYGEDPHVKLGGIFPQRDAFDLALVEAAIKKGKPIFGVCRGMQLLNVYFGGTLYQDLEAQYDEKPLMQHNQQSALSIPVHTVEIEPDSRLASFAGEKLAVNSFHHQGIRKLGDKLRTVAVSADGMIEAFESTDPDIDLLAIQWHPEIRIPEDPISQLFFDDLIERAAKK